MDMHTLDQMLEEIEVLEPGVWENETGPKGWYAVSDKTGIIAYFGKESHAYHFRLAVINDRLNGLC